MWGLLLLFLLGGAVLDPARQDTRRKGGPLFRRLLDSEAFPVHRPQDGGNEGEPEAEKPAEGEEPDESYIKKPEDPAGDEELPETMDGGMDPDKSDREAREEEDEAEEEYDTEQRLYGTPEPTGEPLEEDDGSYEEGEGGDGSYDEDDGTLEPTMEPVLAPDDGRGHSVFLDDPTSPAETAEKAADFIVGAVANNSGQEGLPEVPEKKGSAIVFVAVFLFAVLGTSCCCYCKRRTYRRKGFEKLNPNPPDDSDDDVPMTGSDLNLLEMAAKTPRNAPGVDMREEEQKLVKFIEQNNLLDRRESLGRSPQSGAQRGDDTFKREVVLSHAVAARVPHQESFGVGDASSDEVSSVSEDEDEEDSPPSQVLDRAPARPVDDSPKDRPQQPEASASEGSGAGQNQETEGEGDETDENAPLTSRGRKSPDGDRPG